MATTTEFTVKLENRPGTLAELLETLGQANVNVEGLQGMLCAGQGVVQFVTDNPDGTKQALQSGGIAFETRQVLLLIVPNEPGAGARVSRAMANAGINVDGTYLTFGGQIVTGVDNLAGAEEVARKLGVL